MTEPKTIWQGKYAGVDASVQVSGGVPFTYLAGRLAMHREDQQGIMAAAELGLAAERDTALSRLETVETTAKAACFTRDLLDATGNELRASNRELASLDRAIDDLATSLCDEGGQ
jgi:hypothetical protein